MLTALHFVSCRYHLLKLEVHTHVCLQLKGGGGEVDELAALNVPEKN